MATPSGNSETVRYDILIEAKAAIVAMRDMLKYTNDNTVKMAEFTNQVLMDSKRWGVSWQQALAVYKQLNAELAKNKKGTLFGQTGGVDLMGQTGKYLQSLQDAGRLTDDLTEKTENLGKRGARGIDAMRIALGVLVSMLIFRAIEAVETFFRGAIDQAKQFEETLYRLRNVEETLSLSGIEISMKGLKEGIAEIQELLPIFSKEDVSQLVGNLAISTKQLGLNEQQILDLAKAVGILNVRSEKNEDLSTTAQHVLSSLLTGNAKGISALGIAFTDNTMRAKAMELGFLEAGDALSELTENEKGLTKLNIILESTANETENIGEYLETDTAKLKQNAAAWKDLQVTVGQVILPLVPTLTEGIQLISDGFKGFKVILIEVITLISALGTAWVASTSGAGNFTDVFEASIEKFREALVNDFFKEMPEDAPEWFKRGWGKHIKEEAETATGPVQDLGEALEEIDLGEFQQKIEDILRDTAQAREDLAEQLDRKLADLDEEYRRKGLDAETDYLRKIEDINRDAERDIADLKKKQREEDQRDEEKYQLALWELRQRFLMNLEDALHARDARQIIRLQKQYAIDKEALRRKHELENKEREQGQQEERKQIEDRRQEQLADARLDYERKLADLNLAKQREADDLAKWYEREQQDIELAQQRKLETLIQGWIDEKKITEANAAEVYGILSKYFGPGGMTDSLYRYMMDSLIASTQGAIAGMASMMGSLGARDMSGPIPVTVPTGSTDLINQGVPPSVAENLKFAEGGTLLATRPTTATFGEGGPELVNFTPLSRAGKNVGKLFGDRSGGGINGMIRVTVDLSPDLEGRIVEQSLDGVADVMAQINRSKV
jgi:hypothetical protein